MSHIDDIRRELLDRGIGLTLEGGKLRAIARKGALDEVAVALIRMHRDGLIALLSAAGPNRAPLTRRDRQGLGVHRLPVSYEQGRMWFLQSIDTEPARYNMPLALRVRGDFDESLAERAFERIVGRHEALRTVFEADGQTLSQRVQEPSAFVLGRQDLRGLPESEREGLAWMAAEREATTPFDLARDVMLRASFIRLTDDEGVLLFNVHHIAADGWSMDVVKREFATQYNALRSGRQDNPLAPLAVRYADYAQWQREWLDQDGALEKQLAYWERQLAGLPPVHALALDHARPAQQSFEGATQSFMVDAATTQRLRELGRRTHCTLFMVLHAGLSVLLARHASASDIVIGTPVANRLHKELEDVVGFFANTLVLRTDTSGNPSFEQLLAQVREVNLQAQAHQDVPFEMLVERLNPARSAQYGPLVQIVLNLEAGASAATEAGIALPGLRVTTLGRAVVSAKFELQFNVEEVQGGLALGIDYNCALFEAQTIERMAQHWQRLLHSIAADATLGIHDLPMLAQGESTELLHRLNVRRAVHAVEQGLHERFEAQVRQAPQAIAAEYEGESLSYAELDAQANRLARHLREQGVGVDSLVGLSVERGLPMLVGLLAILKAGGAYVPLDPAYPAGRLAYMVGDSGMKLVLSQSSLRDKLGEITAQTAGIQLLELDDAQLQQQLQRYSAEALERLPGQGPGNLAYIIYTSGSTGQPKGVQIEHANVVRLFESAKRHFAFDASDVWTMFHSYGFDFSVWEIWGALLHGGRLVIVPQAVARSAPEFYELLQQRGVTILNQTPSAFAALVAVDELQPPNPPAALALRQVIFGGEALNLTALRPWMQRHGDASPELVNMYGITETTVHVTYRRIVQADVWAQSPPSVIGEVLDDLSALVLTPQGGLCPLGVAGELYVGGAGLARGYLNRSELTAQRFIANPFHDAQDPRSSERLYRTGDLVRYQADRTLEYLGRIDEQVKIRGFRIELGEIEAQLAAQDGVSNAVVLVQETQPGDKRLIGYVAGSACTGAELKSKLREVLPEYMVPTHIVVLEQLPLTTNGKVDRKALPEPSSEQQEAVYEAPVTSTEKLLASIWAELLQVDVQGIGAQANFFALGGHSLMVIRLMARLQEVGHAVEVRSVFAAPTLRALAQAIDATSQQGGAMPVLARRPQGDALMPLSPAQARLWFIDRYEGGSAHYNLPVAWRVRGDFNVEAAEQALSRLVARHDSLRTVFVEAAEGPAQRVLASADFRLVRRDLRGLDRKLAERQAIEAAAADARTPFDLAVAPLLRASHWRLADEESVLLVNLHHIAADGWSMGLIAREFVVQYEAALLGLGDPLPPLTLQYGDYTQWQRERLQSHDEATRQLAWWSRQLADLPPSHGLPLDHSRPKRQSFDGATHQVKLDVDTTQALRRIAESAQATLFMVVHAALSLLLARHSGSSDVVLGAPVANRPHADLANVVGLFVNTLVLRTEVWCHASFNALLRHVRDVNLQAQIHADLPFEALVEGLRPVRDAAITPLFQIMLSMDALVAGGSVEPPELPGLQLEPLGPPRGAAKFDLSFNLMESGDGGLELGVEYATALFNAGTAARLAQHWSRLLRAVAKDPGQSLHALPMLDADEESALRGLLRGERVDFGRQLVHERIEAVAQRNPQAVAVQQGDEALSYGELDARANQVAHWLVSERGVGPEVRVGLCLDRSIELMVALLGVLKAGGAYVPLDPAYPLERLAYMAEDASLSTVLTQSGHRASLPLGDDRVVCLDEPALRARLAALPTGACAPRGLGPASLAYVIYTSGSTGRPKGVMIEHAALSNLAAVIGRHYSLTPEDGFLQFASINFDMSVEDVFGALCAGCRLVLRDDEWLRSPGEFWSRSEAQGVSVLDLPTAFWHELAMDDAAPAPGVRHISIGGEAVGRAQLQRWLERADTRGVRLVNTYGPTECTVDASFAELDGLEAGIGRLLPNYVGRVLDAHGALCPLGVPGELYLGGAGLARGYLNRPELTAERFVKDPCARDDDDAGRLYRTGDQVCLRADGSLQYLGRIDDQVKIRGFRIELGEIEACLAGHPAVAQAVVLAREDAAGDKQLVAYVSLSEGGEVTPGQLKEQLRQRLPQYMVPAHIVVLQALPLTPNGKVDKRALPAPEAGTEGFEAVLPLQGETEQRLAQIWSELLKLPLQRIGADANFFALGGHSLMVVRLLSRLRGQLDVELGLREVFDAHSLRVLARAVDAAGDLPLRPPVKRGPRDGRLMPLSYGQQRLWFLDRFDGGSVHYNMPMALRVRGAFDPEWAEHALARVVQRHEPLRTVFEGDLEAPRQRVCEDLAFQMAREDLSAWPAPEREKRAQAAAQADALRPFDLTRDLLLRARWLQLAEEEGVLLVNVHHIASDGWSMGLLIDEFMTQYGALSAGQTLDPLPPLGVRYSDYAQWQRDWLDGGALDRQLAYWERQLAQLPPVHGLALDYPRPAQQRFEGATHALVLDADTTRQLSELARREGATLFMLLHAALAVLLAREGGSGDVVIGTPVANRGQKELEDLIGFFVNTLVLRTDASGNPSFVEFLKQVREVNLQAQANADVPFELLVERLKPVRSAAHAPLFQVFLSMDAEVPVAAQPLPGLRVETLGNDEATAKFELTFSAAERDSALALAISYRSALFEPDTIARLAEQWARLLREIAIDAWRPIRALPMRDPAEETALREALRGDRVPFATEACIHELVQAQAQRTPQAVAVQHAHGELSYGELEARANQLARWLRSQGVGPDQRVGLCVTRGPEMIVGLLAILKAGGAYVPLDAENPPERLRHMVTQGGLSLLLSQQGLRDRVTAALPEGVMLALLDEAGFEAELEALEDGALARAEGAGPQDLAYVIFTSGSTGAPKGAMVPHRGFVNLMAWYDALCLERGAEEAVLLLSNFSFDLTQKNVFTTLARGARLVLPAPGPFDPRAVCALIEKRQVSVLNVTPSVFVALLEDGCAQQLGSLRSVVLGGEPIAYARLQEWHRASGCQLVNSYGPTECTDVSSYWVQQPSEDAQLRVPLGVAVPNVDLYVLDAHQGLVGVGVAGELCVGGVGVGRGYLARPELTAERFVSNPFHDPADPVSSTQLYRTGDLVRREADGSLQYLGRIDDQVKIRGFRIELGEVEAQLVRQPGVTAAVVLAREDVPGDKRLVGYVAAQTPLVPAELKAQLQQALPEYMVPAHIVVLQALPLTPNGKVDKRALPAPEGRVQDGQARQPLQGPIEQALAQIWAELLGLPAEHIGAEANFFELGGHSLLTVRLVSRIRSEIGVELPLRAAFDMASLRALAQAVETASSEALRPRVERRPRDEGDLPLSYAQQRLWFIDRFDGSSAHYNIPLALRVRGAFDLRHAEQALQRIVQRHEPLRASFSLVDGRARQQLGSELLQLVHIDLRASPAREALMLEVLAQEAACAFDLSSGLLLRARWLQLAEEEGVLLVNVHHIASDGWSMGLLIDEFMTQYGALSGGQTLDPLPPLGVRYSDYAQWQRDWLDGGALDRQLAYWERQLAQLPPVHGLALDYPRPAQQRFEGATHALVLDADTTRQLSELARREGATLFMLLHAALAVLLAREGGSGDVVIGTPVANRGQKELEDLIGFFVNTLVLRTDASGNPSFVEFLKQVREVNLQAQANADVPFELLVERLKPVRNPAHGPLLQILLNVVGSASVVSAPSAPDLHVEAIEADVVAAKFELQFNVLQAGSALVLSIEYASALFDAGTIARLAEQWARLLREIAIDAWRPIRALPMRDPAEETALREALRGDRVPFATEACIHELVQAQAQRTPQAVAVQHAHGELSYGELEARANQLARWLRSQGVGPDQRVGLCVTRGPEMIVGLLAILKAGGAYVPLDAENPPERLRHMVTQGGLSLLLSQQGLRDRVTAALPEGVMLALLDEAGFEAELEALEDGALARAEGAGPQDLAYVIFTSGSTGAPKGAMVPHRGFVNLMAWYDALCLERGAEEAVLLLSNFSFDLTQKNVFTTLARGARLVLPAPGPFDPRAVCALIEERQVSVLNVTPSVFVALLEDGCAQQLGSLRSVVLGGEPIAYARLQEWHRASGCQLVNSYGPTECTDVSSYWVQQPSEDAQLRVPLGVAVPNVDLYVLDAHQGLVGVGVAGELCVGGVGVGRGYLARPELTAERFVSNPFHDPADPVSSTQLYRTGDLVRREADGSLQYLGRIDDQVKIRGFRIELGEIEAQLVRQPGVTAAVVLAREDVPGDKRLVGYVAAQTPLVPAELKAQLQQALPEYMVPAHIVVLQALPLTPNGKVDKRALPAPEGRVQDGQARQPLQGHIEQALAQIWAELLGLPAEHIGAEANFFELGGHSLLAIRLATQVRERLRIELALRDLFASATLAELALKLQRNATASYPAGAPSPASLHGEDANASL